MGDGQVGGLLEQILGQREDELVDRQQRRLLPTADELAERRQLLTHAQRLAGQLQPVQPVPIQPRPEKILDLLAPAQRAGHPIDVRLGLILLTLMPAPYPVDGRQPGRRGRVGQIVDDVAQRPRRLAGGPGGAQKLDVRQAAFLQLGDQLEAATVARHQHGDGGLLVVGQPAGHRVHHRLQFRRRGKLTAHEVHLGGIVGRIGLRIAGRRGLDVRRSQCVPDGHHRVLLAGPIDQPIGQRDDAAGGAAGVGQFPRDDA